MHVIIECSWVSELCAHVLTLQFVRRIPESAFAADCCFMVNVVRTKTPGLFLQSCFPVIDPKLVMVHGVIPPQISSWHSAIDPVFLPVKLLRMQTFRNWKTNHSNFG